MTQESANSVPALPPQLNILAIEDSPYDAAIILQELRRAGLNVRMDVAKTAVEVAAFLLGGHYDLVLSDYGLRGWTGLEALEAVRERQADIPFILVTGSLGEEKAVEFIKLGAADYILKDRLGRLPHAITEALEKKERKEKQRAGEAALRESEERFRRLVEISPEAIFVGCRGVVVFINPAGVKLFGAREETELLGKTVADLVHPDFQQAVNQKIEQHEGTDFAAPVQEERFRRLDDTFVDVEVSAIPFQWKGRASLQVVARDITERKRAEEALRVSELALRSMVEKAPYGIYRANVRTAKFISVNPALVRMLGYDSVEEVLRLDIARDVYCSPRERDRVLQILRAGGGLREQEVRWKRRGGQELLLRSSGRLVHGVGGEEYFEAIAEDITQRRVLEEQLRQAQKMEAIGQLAGGVAHDFNNLLMAISSFSELAGEAGPINEKQRHYLDEVLKASRRAARLTQQLLAFSRKQILMPTVLDLNAVVQDLGRMLPRLIGEHIQLRVLAQAAYSRIEADRGQMDQVMMNLAINARDAMPNGGTLVMEVKDAVFDQSHVGSNYTIPAGHYVLLAVSDNGVGMDSETLGHIFEPFFTTKEKGRGTGLGLAMVYGIVKQSGGYISVYSEKEIGTTFKMYFPRAEKPLTADRGLAPPQPAAGGTETILLVEDEQAVRFATREFLQSKGYAVIEAANGAEALEKLTQQVRPIDLLITDMVMPGMTGRELAARLCRHPNGPQVLYISGYTDGAIASVAGLEKEADFLQKPFSLELLAQKVRAALDAVPAVAHG